MALKIGKATILDVSQGYLLIELTHKERKMLELLISKHPTGPSRNELVKEVWDGASNVEDNTIHNLKLRLSQKFGDKYIVCNAEGGYRFAIDPEPYPNGTVPALGQRGTSRFGAEPEPQKVRWGPLDAHPAGIRLIGPGEAFVPWAALKNEIETKLLNQLGRVLPKSCTVALQEFHGQKDWRVVIVDAQGLSIGRVWFGPNPRERWTWDGMVRVGAIRDDYRGEVWQVFQRYSDGSYRLVEALDDETTRSPQRAS